ncbi:glutamine-hydrolyzing carbamoyl-phosphate synthase small subunit [Candidatus Woesearchaeota archaeon]|nr:glutamine-hydrolyzing carbamoyl-phosphate synthase small subunit [Candidatus Woesearchaeota archaeon]
MGERSELVLEDGSRFPGMLHGAPLAGEVVFSTGMTGYPEAFTDPSYRGQILVMTYPLMGNFGIGRKMESERAQIAGLVVSSLVSEQSHHRATSSLLAWLQEQGVPVLADVDTRSLTRRLRERGVMLGAFGGASLRDPNSRNLVAEVSIAEKRTYGTGGKRIVLVDCGVKASILSSLRGTVIRVPWDHNALDEQPDAIVVSNGPGDPQRCGKAIAHLAEALDAKVPVLGICLGHQLLALAAGGETYKLRYGHRSHNQPCIELSTGRCFITSQNHGYAVRAESLPEGWSASWTNANDQTNEGISHRSGLFSSVQFHPEGNPGPADTAFLFHRLESR